MSKKNNDTAVTQEGEEKMGGFVEKNISSSMHKPKGSTGPILVSAEEKQKIDQKILEIYENPDGSLPDMKNFQKRKRASFAKAFFRLAVACAFLGGVAWAGFFVWQPKSAVGENDVILTLSSGDKIVAGADTQFRIRYRNSEGVNLKNVKLQVSYPEDFVFSTSSLSPEQNSKDEWKIGDLAAGDSGFIDIIGKLYGEVGQEQSFRVFLTYTPENFSSQFQKSAVLVRHVTDSPVVLDVQNSSTSEAGASNQIQVSVRPVSDLSLANVAIVLDPGDNQFTKVSSEPAAEKLNSNRWPLDVLSKEAKVTIKGYYAPVSSGVTARQPQIKIYAWKDSRRSGEGYLLASKILEQPQVTSAGQVVVKVNESSVDTSVQPGEELKFTLNFKNNGSESLKNVTVRMVIDAPSKNKKSLMDWPGIKDTLDGDIKGEQLSDSLRRGIIVWGPSKTKDLEQIDPGQEFKLEFTLPIKSAKNFDMSGISNSDISVSSDVQYDLSGKKEIASSVPLKLSLGSDLGFEVRDSVISVQDGQKHSVNWIISNSYHPLKDITVEADVYGDVSWLPSDLQVPAGEVNFEPALKKITWKIGEMPESLDILALQWAVVLKNLNPTQTNLTSKIKLSATDAVTGEKISKIADGIILNN